MGGLAGLGIAILAIVHMALAFSTAAVVDMGECDTNYTGWACNVQGSPFVHAADIQDQLSDGLDFSDVGVLVDGGEFIISATIFNYDILIQDNIFLASIGMVFRIVGGLATIAVIIVILQAVVRLTPFG